MSRSYSRVAEGFSFDPTSGESAGNRRNDFCEADQERYEGAKHNTRDNTDAGSGTHRAGFPAYGADHRDGQGHLEDRSRQRSDPMAALSDQQVDRRDQVRQSVPNHNSRLEVDPRNTTYLHGTHPQESEHSGEDTRFNRPGWLPHSDDTREVMLTLDSNSGGDAFGNQKSYGEQPQYPIPPPAEDAIPHRSMSRQELSYYTQLAHQEVSPRIEPCSDWRMDFPIDSNPGWYIDVASAPREEVEHKEEVPWSSVNLLSQHNRIPIAKLNMMADMAGAYETGRANHDSGDALNLVASTAASTGDSEDHDWGVISAAIICPAIPAAGNLSDPTGYASDPFHQGQGQGAFVLPEYPPAGQYNVPMQYPQRQTATQDTSRQT